MHFDPHLDGHITVSGKRKGVIIFWVNRPFRESSSGSIKGSRFVRLAVLTSCSCEVILMSVASVAISRWAGNLSPLLSPGGLVGGLILFWIVGRLPLPRCCCHGECGPGRQWAGSRHIDKDSCSWEISLGKTVRQGRQRHVGRQVKTPGPPSF